MKTSKRKFDKAIYYDKIFKLYSDSLPYGYSDDGEKIRISDAAIDGEISIVRIAGTRNT